MRLSEFFNLSETDFSDDDEPVQTNAANPFDPPSKIKPKATTGAYGTLSPHGTKPQTAAASAQAPAGTKMGKPTPQRIGDTGKFDKQNIPKDPKLAGDAPPPPVSAKPPYKGSFVGQTWTVNDKVAPKKFSYQDRTFGNNKYGAKEAETKKSLVWDGNDWVSKDVFDKQVKVNTQQKAGAKIESRSLQEWYDVFMEAKKSAFPLSVEDARGRNPEAVKTLEKLIADPTLGQAYAQYDFGKHEDINEFVFSGDGEKMFAEPKSFDGDSAKYEQMYPLEFDGNEWATPDQQGADADLDNRYTDHNEDY